MKGPAAAQDIAWKMMKNVGCLGSTDDGVLMVSWEAGKPGDCSGNAYRLKACGLGHFLIASFQAVGMSFDVG